MSEWKEFNQRAFLTFDIFHHFFHHVHWEPGRWMRPACPKCLRWVFSLCPGALIHVMNMMYCPAPPGGSAHYTQGHWVIQWHQVAALLHPRTSLMTLTMLEWHKHIGDQWRHYVTGTRNCHVLFSQISWEFDLSEIFKLMNNETMNNLIDWLTDWLTDWSILKLSVDQQLFTSFRDSSHLIIWLLSHWYIQCIRETDICHTS